MQKSESKKDYGALTIKTMNLIPSPDRNLLAQFYSFDDDGANIAVSPQTMSPVKEEMPKTEPLLRSPSSVNKAKEIQVQLEINQSKLNSLVKRIDDCLSASKTGYASAQVIQKSMSSLSVSSVADNKEVKVPEQTIQEFKPDEPSDEALLSPNLSNGVMKSVRASMDTTTEEIAMSLGIKRKSMDNIKKNNFQQNGKVGQNSQAAIKPAPVSQRGPAKGPVQKTVRPSTGQKGPNPMGVSDIQKKIDTVSSVAVDTVEDLPKLKEKSSSNRSEKQGNVVVNKKGVSQTKSTVSDFRASTSNLTEVEKSGVKVPNEMTQSEHRGNTRTVEKARSPGRNEPKVPAMNKQNSKSISTNTLEKKNSLNEEKKISTSKPKPQRSPQAVKSEVSKKEPVNKGLPSSKVKNNSGLMQLPAECLDLEAIRMISPVSQDTKSAKGIYDFSTPGYNFESPMHQNANNLSVNDSKNLSFDSALFGKDVSLKMDGFETRRKSGFNVTNEQNLKRNNSAKNEKSFKEEELEVGFTKAYTTRKNRIVNEGSDFIVRRDSDLYYRRKYRVDLEKFLDECKPKLSEEQTERLIQRLVEDGRRREAKAHRLEHERENRERRNSTPSMSEDQLNQTFERLVNDAKKRLLVQEEVEKVKLIKQEEMEKSIQRERSKSKINKDSEDRLVSKLVEDADRRRLQYEKAQRAKAEEEIRQANELQSQGFKAAKNNKAKSKVKEYINSKTEISIDHQDRKDKAPRSLQRTEKSRTPSPVEILPTIHEKPSIVTKRGPNNKKMFLSIASPSNKAAEAKEHAAVVSKVSPKNNSVSSLEHLQSLRKNIGRYKTDIEEHIQNIEDIEGSQVRCQPSSQSRLSQQMRKSEVEKIASPKKDKLKVTSKYDHIESKVAKHIENMNTKQSQVESIEEVEIVEVKELPKTAVASPKGNVTGKEIQREERLSLDFPRTTLISPKAQNAREMPKDVSKQAKTDRDSLRNRISSQQTQAKFMSDKAAIDFVDKLISEFKIVKNM